MTNCIKKIIENDAVNLIPLSMITADLCYSREDYSLNTVERFVQSASQLPETDFLGWQLSALSESKLQVSAFSLTDTEISKDDIGWIFQNCAVPGSAAQPCKWNNGLQRTYVLSYKPGKSDEAKIAFRSNNSNYDSSAQMRHCQDVLNAVMDFGATLILAAGRNGKGFLLIGLPAEITFRMRTMLALAFPDTVVSQVSGSIKEDIAYLPSDCLSEGMAGLLNVLMLKENRLLFNKADTAGPDEDAEEFTPIEDLDLSVRSYNCLMRAGIDSIEKLRSLSDDDLLHIRNLSSKCVEEIRKALAENTDDAPVPLTAPDYFTMLEEMVGLENVKEHIKKIIAFAKMKKDLTGNQVPVSLNMAFVGNPGTAKTTVARILAGIFCEAGILSGKEMIEVGRADLVAEYVGQTAEKVKSVFRRAKGKLLFIDEAYSLVEDGRGEFGDEAINTIVQEMENHRDETIVVFAGYPEQMEEFLSRNPGLRSRVPFIITFDDNSAEELVQIAALEAGKRGFCISADAYEKISAICSVAAKNSEMGNGRFSRNLIEEAILNYASRVYGSEKVASDNNLSLISEDFVFPVNLTGTKKIPIGFCS